MKNKFDKTVSIFKASAESLKTGAKDSIDSIRSHAKDFFDTEEKPFNPEDEVENIIQFIREYFKKCHLKGVVLGISGGKDSGVVAALFSKALGSENVLGVTMPCHSAESDRNDAKLVADAYGFELINLDLTNVYDSFMEQVNVLGQFGKEELKNSEINLKPRLRMATCYFLAALRSARKGGTYLVAGTSNKCELFVGYFTKGGDSTYDIGVLNDYTVEEVIQIGEYLGVPNDVLHKSPSDGLSGMTDEDKLGVSYSAIARFMAKEFANLSEAEMAKIEKLHNNSKHKFNIPVYRRK